MVRVCPKRDAVCPHGMECPYVKDAYSCHDEKMVTAPLDKLPARLTKPLSS